MDWGFLGYAVCHQIADRSLRFGSNLSPLCSRCSGIYLGFFLTILFLYLSGGFIRKGCKLPDLKYSLILIFFVVIMGVDVFAEKWGLYPRNVQMSFLTGLLMGLSLGNFIIPVFNFTFWERSDRIALLNGVKFLELLFLLLTVYLMVVLIKSVFFIPLVIGSFLGLIALYLFINSLIYLILFKRENLGTSYKDLLPLVLVSSLMTGVEFTILATIKTKITLAGL